MLAHGGIRAIWLFGACLSVCACQASGAGGSASPVFGGKGAQIATPDERPLPEGAGKPESLGPCGKNSPPNDTALIDDFEDGNARIFKAFERDGFWFSASDKTEGSSISPQPFAPELLPAAESTKENRYAVHLAASGEKNWGVVWGAQLQWTHEGLRCPLNASSYAGVKLRAKGPGKIRVSLAVPEVQPKDGGGTCKDRCYDSHGKIVLLSDAWDTYEIRWEKLQQGGWGTEARFTPERLVNLALNVPVDALPIDIWVDDVELIPKNLPTTAAR
jgi:hypothetical protein